MSEDFQKWNRGSRLNVLIKVFYYEEKEFPKNRCLGLVIMNPFVRKYPLSQSYEAILPGSLERVILHPRILAQIVLVLKKKQFEKVELAEINF